MLADQLRSLDQEDRLVVLAGQDRVIAFDEHVVGSIRGRRGGCKKNIVQLDTTGQTHKTPVGVRNSFKNPARMGEDQSGNEKTIPCGTVVRGGAAGERRGRPAGRGAEAPGCKVETFYESRFREQR